MVLNRTAFAQAGYYVSFFVYDIIQIFLSILIAPNNHPAPEIVSSEDFIFVICNRQGKTNDAVIPSILRVMRMLLLKVFTERNIRCNLDKLRYNLRCVCFRLADSTQCPVIVLTMGIFIREI